MSQRHLSDDRLIEIALSGPDARSSEPHLVACAECEVRRASLAQMLDDVSTSATAEADQAFPPERLARQRARILQRLEHEGRPARVIAFPAGHPQAPSLLRSARTTRWTAAAAAAAFFVGLMAGHMANNLPGDAVSPVVPRMAVNDTSLGTHLRVVPATMSEEEFLGQVEVAVGSAGPAALRPIDALTPRAWEIR